MRLGDQTTAIASTLIRGRFIQITMVFHFFKIAGEAATILTESFICCRIHIERIHVCIY